MVGIRNEAQLNTAVEAVNNPADLETIRHLVKFTKANLYADHR